MWQTTCTSRNVNFSFSRNIFEISTVITVKLFRENEFIQSTVGSQRSVARFILYCWLSVCVSISDFIHEYWITLEYSNGHQEWQFWYSCSTFLARRVSILAFNRRNSEFNVGNLEKKVSPACLTLATISFEIFDSFRLDIRSSDWISEIFTVITYLLLFFDFYCNQKFINLFCFTF